MEEPRSGQPVTIRMFHDYSDVTLWLDDPVGYEDSCVSAELATDLKRWEQAFYDSTNEDFEWLTPQSASAHTAQGNVLAQRVADEVGPGFEIEFSTYEPGVSARIFRAVGPAQNADAARAFSELAGAWQREQVELERLREETQEQGGQWFAYAPGSGDMFVGGDDEAGTGLQGV